MSTPKNLSNTFMPHPESRRSTSPALTALNAEHILLLDGDNSATIYLDSQGVSFNGTYTIQGSFDGVNFFDVMAHPYAPASLGGTLPQPGQPLVAETINAIFRRVYSVATGGMRAIRVRIGAFTAGSFVSTITADVADPIVPYVRHQKSATLMVSTTAAVGASASASLAAVPGLRHYVDRISVVRSATAALTPSATPVVVSVSNLPGSPALTFGSDAGGIGVDKEMVLDFGGSGIAATAINTATIISCPAYVGVIWRVNVSYRLGL